MEAGVTPDVVPSPVADVPDDDTVLVVLVVWLAAVPVWNTLVHTNTWIDWLFDRSIDWSIDYYVLQVFYTFRSYRSEYRARMLELYESCKMHHYKRYVSRMNGNVFCKTKSRKKLKYRAARVKQTVKISAYISFEAIHFFKN